MNYHFGWRKHIILIYNYGDFPLNALEIEIDNSFYDHGREGYLYNACKTWADYYTVNGRKWADLYAEDFLELVLGEGVPLQVNPNPTVDIAPST